MSARRGFFPLRFLKRTTTTTQRCPRRSQWMRESALAFMAPAQATLSGGSDKC